jgi:hypothetical protein
MRRFEQDWLELGSRVHEACTTSTPGTSDSSRKPRPSVRVVPESRQPTRGRGEELEPSLRWTTATAVHAARTGRQERSGPSGSPARL